MRKVYVAALLAVNVLAGGSYAVAEDAGSGFKAPVAGPVRGSFSSEEKRAERAAALKAKMKSIEEGRNRPAAEEVVAPIERRTVRGSDQIKAKIEASKESGKKGTAKLKGFFSGVLGGMRSLSDMLSGSEGKEKLSAKQREREMSFKERLKLEKERQRRRNAAR